MQVLIGLLAFLLDNLFFLETICSHNAKCLNFKGKAAKHLFISALQLPASVYDQYLGSCFQGKKESKNDIDISPFLMF